MADATHIHADCSILFSRLNEILAGEGGIEAPGNVTILSIVLRGDTEWLYADADVTGPYSGKATLQFKPTYNQFSRKFYVSDVEIQLAEDSIFGKFAGKMVNNLLGNKLDAKLEELINAKFGQIIEEVITGLRSVQLPKAGELQFNTDEWQLSDLATDGQGIHFKASLTGQTKLIF